MISVAKFGRKLLNGKRFYLLRFGRPSFHDLEIVSAIA